MESTEKNGARSSSNLEALRADLADIRTRLEALASDGVAPDGAFEPRADAVRDLRSACGLSAFETSLLMLAVATELDAAVATLCGRLAGQQGAGCASFALASRLFDAPDWRALLPTSPLRYWRLVDVEPRRSDTLAEAPVKVSERVLHQIVGLVYLDESLHALLTVCEPSRDLWPGHAAAAARLARHWTAHPDAAIAVTGSDARSRRFDRRTQARGTGADHNEFGAFEHQFWTGASAFGPRDTPARNVRLTARRPRESRSACRR